MIQFVATTCLLLLTWFIPDGEFISSVLGQRCLIECRSSLARSRDQGAVGTASGSDSFRSSRMATSVSVHAGFFSVVPTQTNAQVERLCSDYCRSRNDDLFQVEHDFKKFSLIHFSAHAGGAFTGTVCLVRNTRLPFRIRGRQSSSLPIEPEDNVGEPASFAYIPVRQLMLVEYNHNGPRHAIIRQFLYKAGLTAPVAVTPILREDAVQRLGEEPFIRKLQFALTQPTAAQQKILRRAGGAVADALHAMADCGGIRIDVTVSMSHEKGALSDRAKAVLAMLMNHGENVQTLKATVKETDDHAAEVLDFLGSRRTIEFDVRERGRELDPDDCRQRLLRHLNEYRG